MVVTRQRPGPVTRFLPLSTAALLSALLTLTGCQSDPHRPADTPSGTLRSRETAPQTRPAGSVDVPPGVDPERLQPRTDEALRKARLPLKQAVASVPTPAYLQKAQPTPTASGGPIDPPLAAQKLFAFAKLDLQEGKPAEAAQKLEAASKLAPQFVELHRLLAQTWLSLGNTTAAAQAVREALRIEPDLQSLLLVGRYTLDTNQFEEAIAALHEARLRHAAQPEHQQDPAIDALIAFYLGTALSRAGFDAAALDEYDRYLSVPRNSLRGGSPSNELLFLDRRQPGLLIDLGDLQHRLNQPESALQSYDTAQDLGLNDSALTARKVYSLLRLGRADEATDRVVEQVAAAGNDPRSIALVQYAVANGVPADRLVVELRKHYLQQQEPAQAMVLALAAALPTQPAIELLEEHLERQPDDYVVLDRLIGIELNDPKLRDQGPRQALLRSAEVIERTPDAAPRRVAALLAGVQGDASKLMPAIDAHDESDRSRSSMQLIKALLHSSSGQDQQARPLLEQVLSAQPDYAAARVELARLMAVDGQVQQAEQLLADATDPLSPGVAELRATLLAQLGRREEALAMTDRLLAQRPGQDRLIIERARLLESLDRVNDAERGLLDALTAQPREEVLYAALLDLYERHGELTRNYTWVARRLLANLPQSRLAKFVLAENHEARQDFPQAERLLKEILQEHPGDIQATQLLIEIYLRSERANEAAELAQQIAQRQPRNPEARKVLIRALVLQRDLPAAAEAMEQFTRDFPEDDSVSMQLVQAYAQQERWDDAARHLDALLKRTPDNLRLLNDAAIIYQQAGRKEQALPILDKLINQLPPGLDRDQHRAMALALRNDIGGALGIVREWVATQEAEQATLAASLVWQILEPLPAEEAVDKLIALLDQLPVPSRTPVAFPTSIQLEQRGDGLAAERLLEKLLKDTPDDAMINNSLGYRLAMQGKRLDEAKAMIQKALDAEPENGAYQDSLGWVLYKQGNFQGAEQWLSKALAREPYPVIADHLGDALYRLDRKEQAVQMWQRALTPLDEPIQFPDPELEGLADRLNAKIEAVTNDQPAPVSPMAGE